MENWNAIKMPTVISIMSHDLDSATPSHELGEARLTRERKELQSSDLLTFIFRLKMSNNHLMDGMQLWICECHPPA